MSALKTCVASAAITCAVGCTTSLWSPEPPRSFAGYRPDPDVVDGRGRFREIYTAVRADHGRELPADRPVADALHDLGDEPAGSTGAAGSAGTLPVHIGPPRTSLRIMIVPGLFGECVLGSLSPFSHARAHLAEHGYRTELILVSGRSSCEHNARQIRDALVTTRLDADDRLVLVGYSKGAVDSLVAVTEYPEVRDRVAAVVSMAGPIGGTSVADDLDGILSDMLRMLDVPGCPRGDGGAIDGLRSETRQTWLATHALPKEIRFYSVVAFANRPNTSLVFRSTYDELATIDPRNDGQVALADAIIPGSTLVGFASVDHWGIALSIDRDLPLLAHTLVDHNAYPREVLLESVIRFVGKDLLAQ